MTAERDDRKGNAPGAEPNDASARASGEDEVRREVAATANATIPDFRFSHQPPGPSGRRSKGDPTRGQRSPDAAIGSAIKDFASSTDALPDFDFSELPVARTAPRSPSPAFPAPERVGAGDAVGVTEPPPLAMTAAAPVTLAEIASASGATPLFGLVANAPRNRTITIAPDVENTMARAIAAMRTASTEVAPKIVALTAADLVIEKPLARYVAARPERNASDANEMGDASEGNPVAAAVTPVLATISLVAAERDPPFVALQPGDLILDTRPSADSTQESGGTATVDPPEETSVAAANPVSQEKTPGEASDLGPTIDSPEVVVEATSSRLTSPSNDAIAAVAAIPIYGRSSGALASDPAASSAIPIYGPPNSDRVQPSAHDVASDALLDSPANPVPARNDAAAIPIPVYGPTPQPLSPPIESTDFVVHNDLPETAPDAEPAAPQAVVVDLSAGVERAIMRTLATIDAVGDGLSVDFAQSVAETRELAREIIPPSEAASPAAASRALDEAAIVDAPPAPADSEESATGPDGAPLYLTGADLGAITPDERDEQDDGSDSPLAEPAAPPIDAELEASAPFLPDPSSAPDIVSADEAHLSSTAAQAPESLLDIDPLSAGAFPPDETIAAPAEPGAVILRAIGVTRHGPGGLDGVDIELRRGEILALVGDYGSGVETMVDILAGDQMSDAGSLAAALDGAGAALAPIAISSRRAALRAGIKAVRRHPALAGSLTGLQNIAMGSGSLLRPRLSRRTLRRTLLALQKEYEFRVPLDTRTSDMSAGERMMLDLLGAVHRGSPVIIIDNPLACLTMPEVDQLFRTMRRLAADGFSQMLSTRHPEVALAIADRILVLRLGRIVTDLDARGEDRGTLGAYFAARAVERARPAPQPPGRSVLELSGVSARTGGSPASSIVGVSLDLRSSEIIGIAGKPGNGQEALAAIAWGALAPSQGVIKLHGRAPRASNPALFARAGVAKMPLDCRDALVSSMTVAENLVLDAVHRKHFSRYGVINFAAMRRYAAKVISAYGIACSGPDASIAELSEADARKLVYARMISAKPHIIVAHGLTAGCDLATRSEIHRQVLEERDDGAAILLISNDTDELLSLCDQIAVLYRGRLSVLQPAGAFDHHSLNLMMGGEGSMAHDWSGWGGAV